MVAGHRTERVSYERVGQGNSGHGKAGLHQVRAQAPGLPMRQRDAGHEEGNIDMATREKLSMREAKIAWPSCKVAHRAEGKARARSYSADVWQRMRCKPHNVPAQVLVYGAVAPNPKAHGQGGYGRPSPHSQGGDTNGRQCLQFDADEQYDLRREAMAHEPTKRIEMGMSSMTADRPRPPTRT